MTHSIVKDLVWNHFDVRGKFDLIGVWDANSIIGTFTIDKNGQKFVASLGSLGTLGPPVASLDEAKAIAFDYLQKEVLSTLALPTYPHTHIQAGNAGRSMAHNGMRTT